MPRVVRQYNDYDLPQPTVVIIDDDGNQTWLVNPALLAELTPSQACAMNNDLLESANSGVKAARQTELRLVREV